MGSTDGVGMVATVDSRRAPRCPAPVRFVALVILAGLFLASGSATGVAIRPEAENRADRGPDGGIGPAGDRSTDRDQPAAVRELRRAARAEWTTAYAGTKFIAIWTAAAGNPAEPSMSELVDVTNVPGRGTVIGVHRDADGGSPDTGSPEPGRSAGPAEDRSPSATVVDSPAVSIDALAHGYSVHLAGSATSIHRQATVVAARRRDGTVAARFWIDRSTGLLLRRELFTRDGALTRASGFVSARIGTRVGRSDLPPALTGKPADVIPPASYEGLADRGWDCCDRQNLPGGLGLYDVRTTDDGATLHLSYSDGLTSASVFQQRGRLEESALDGFAVIRVDNAKIHVRYGLSSYAVWAHDGLVYTAVCDTPEAVNAVVEAFPHGGPRPDGTGLAQRLDRGMSRMVSWLNPFD